MVDSPERPSPHIERLVLDGNEIELETGRLARQADGAVVVRQGRAWLLATVVARPSRYGDRGGFLPLTVEYRERMAAAGRIPGSRGRREGRISDREILVSRLIDRTLRPLFADGFTLDTQVLVTVYGAEPETDVESLGLVAAAAAVHVSSLPFDGPVAGLRITRRHGRLSLLDASATSDDDPELELIVSASRRGISMVEGRADQVVEADLVEALEAAQNAISDVLDTLDSLREAGGKPKMELPLPPRDTGDATKARHLVEQRAAHLIDEAMAIADKIERSRALHHARDVAVEADGDDDVPNADTLASAFDTLKKKRLRQATARGGRIGGRAHDEVRAIDTEVGTLGSNHGSALFTRGETQSLVSVTLGNDRDAAPQESLDPDEPDRRFMLHYNFPPFSVGDVRPMRGPGRREIGHGNLARTALMPVLPTSDAFPYVIRVVSDILESNGSSSMATVCGGSLALMDAGVPLKAPVAGIAMGLVVEGDDTTILSDILGDEDHFGDMDFKVAGTAEGITAVQLDNKLGSLPRELLARALEQARRGRLHILEAMARSLEASRPNVAEHAPQAAQLRINPGRIGALIGPGGKNIKSIQADTQSRISVDNDGTVRIMAGDAEGLRAAVKRVEAITLELQKGGLYMAEVVTVKDFGAFVRIGEHEGLVHISELAEGRVESVESVVALGDRILVRVTGADDRGRLTISRRAAKGSSAAEALNA